MYCLSFTFLSNTLILLELKSFYSINGSMITNTVCLSLTHTCFSKTRVTLDESAHCSSKSSLSSIVKAIVAAMKALSVGKGGRRWDLCNNKRTRQEQSYYLVDVK